MKILFPQIAIIAATVIWSSSFIALKVAFREYDPMVVIFGRMVIGSLSFLLIRLRYRFSYSYCKGDYKLLFLMALSEPCLYFVFEAHAILYTTASQAGMITALLPVMVMIAASFLLGERNSVKSWCGALLAVFCVIVLTLANEPQQNAPNPILGNFLEAMAMLCGAGYTIAIRKLCVRYSPFFLTAIQAFVGSFFFFPFLFLPGTSLPNHFNGIAILAICYLGAVVTLGAYGLYNYGLKYLSASKASAYINLIPVFSVILGWALLDEYLSGVQFIAASGVMLGVWLTQQNSRKNSSQQGDFSG